MALIPCAACERQISQMALTCPRCGHPVAQHQKATELEQVETPKGTPVWLVLVSLLLGVLAAIVFIGSLLGRPGATPRSKDKIDIKACYDELKKERSGTEEWKILFEACRTLEDKYEREYGKKYYE